MGRSRAVYQGAVDNPNQNGTAQKPVAQEISEPKGAFYHCNYCNKDISGKIRTKCVVCPDFDLCIECLSVGAELTPHKCNHPYRVMDNLAFPLICPDWNVDEEMLLLEGIEMYGFGNWTEVSEHVGTKTRQQCIDHYKAIYMNSPHFPLPGMSHVMGKSREELLALAKGCLNSLRSNHSEARTAGCTTASEASRYLEEKRKKEAEQSALRTKESSQAGKGLQISPRGSFKGSTVLHPISKDTYLTTQAISSSLDYWDITGLVGADLLSETEQRLRSEFRILPSHYLNMLQTISTEIVNGNVKKQADAHRLFKVEPSKVDRVYDMLVKKGMAEA
ncbi:transcriptional adapter ADA2-like [Pyrus x bretschneideri]|uniref:transcriptional adapter ADA2-like n=1 Tax=Pyrus x bretschneideri TaxID=225117 RepID=UPI002030E6FD|nr:transcriptional adapter ADA2-like [Pyrus x bretschneideri]